MMLIWIIWQDNFGGACGVMVIFIENGHGKLSSNPAWGCLHFN